MPLHDINPFPAPILKEIIMSAGTGIWVYFQEDEIPQFSPEITIILMVLHSYMPM